MAAVMHGAATKCPAGDAIGPTCAYQSLACWQVAADNSGNNINLYVYVLYYTAVLHCGIQHDHVDCKCTVLVAAARWCGCP